MATVGSKNKNYKKLVASGNKVDSAGRVVLGTAGSTPVTTTTKPTTTPKTGSGSAYTAPTTLEGIKSEALRIQGELAKLKSGESTTGVTSSSGDERKRESELGREITTLSAPGYQAPARNTSYLKEMEQAARETLRGQEASIKSDYAQLQKDTEKVQKSEVGQTSSMLARVGGYLGESGSGTGVVLNLAASHRAEIGKLESQRQSALQQAREAYQNKQFDIAKLKLQEAKDYEQEVYSRQQDFFQNQRAALADARAAGITPANQKKVYEAITNGAKSVEEIFSALDGAVSADEIANFVNKVKPKALEGDLFEFDANDTVLLLGAGMSQDDIAEVQTYVNENGYTDAFRQTLTASERRILDSIYYPKPVKTGVGNGLTIAEAKTLGLPTSLIGRSQEQIIADLSGGTPPGWFGEYVQSGFADPTAEPTAEGLQPLWQDFREEVLSQNAIENRKGSSGGDGGISFSDVQ